MPDLNTFLHLNMLNNFKKKNRLFPRLVQALRKEILEKNIYGLQWGDPETVPPLKFVRDRYVLPYVNAQHTAVEIGPGGGRWTQYLVGFKKLYVVDYYSELLEQLRKNFNQRNIVFSKNNGTDFPGIDSHSIDYLFSFGAFVHMDNQIITEYLNNIKSIMKLNSNIVIQYSDKTKIMAREMGKDFSDNTPEKMRQMVLEAGYRILEEDLTTMWHSSIIRLTV